MCGINGILAPLPSDELQSRIVKMNDRMAHRGPNAEGTFVDHQLALGHRRLSILDLDERSNQPFSDASGRFTLVFNGEIYNYKEIRAQLKNVPWRTESDTEVLLYAFIEWGNDCLRRLNGMFAFAIWDKQERELFIARDRLGIKPLYYAQKNGGMAFSSEVRSLLKSGLAESTLNHSALPDYLMYHTVHAPETIVEGVHMLMPGHFISAGENHFGVSRYWNPEQDLKLINPKRSDAVEIVRILLKNAVQRRLMSDVPFGAFLSGGIDSSAVVALMAGEMGRPVDTFNVAFSESEYSEAPFARMIAEKFGTRHHEIVVAPGEFLATLPEALKAVDHPGADGPNTWIVSRAAKMAGVTMVLSGLGGDEFFGGYDVFRQLPKLEDKKWILSFPRPLRSMAGKLRMAIKPSVASSKMAELLVQDFWDLEYTYRFSRMTMPEKQVQQFLGLQERFANPVYNLVKEVAGHGNDGYRFDLFTRISLAEMNTYLTNVLLRDTDQMSMAHALEVRVPMLDHTLVEYLLSIPSALKVSETSPKQLLVEAMGTDLPPELVNRPKMGFTFPWKMWLKNELKDFTTSHLNDLAKRPQFQGNHIEKLWRDFEADSPNSRWAAIWNLAVLEHYLQTNGIS
jgi:asparagine synthase (glutamine-hydrolysing)